MSLLPSSTKLTMLTYFLSGMKPHHRQHFFPRRLVQGCVGQSHSYALQRPFPDVNGMVHACPGPRPQPRPPRSSVDLSSGARWFDRPAGGLGDSMCWSLGQAKVVSRLYDTYIYIYVCVSEKVSIYFCCNLLTTYYI